MYYHYINQHNINVYNIVQRDLQMHQQLFYKEWPWFYIFVLIVSLLNIIVENHGGYSSDAKWLVDVIKNTERNNVGSLPDFGNFCILGNFGKKIEKFREIGKEIGQILKTKSNNSYKR